MIEFDQVSKVFPGPNGGTTAVRNFSAQLPAHTTTVFVGSSGSGKTTLLRMVNRMVDPTSGTVRIDGEDISQLDPTQLRRRIGYVMQNGGLLPHKTVEHNIGTVLHLQRKPKSEIRERVVELTELVGLDTTMLRRYPHQLSGGQQQRVGVARALAANPNILLMDEPFGAVDPLVRADLQQELLRLQSELGKTIIFVTHDFDEALILGDRIIVFETGGVVAQSGTGSEILANPASDFVAQFAGLGRGLRELTGHQCAGNTVLTDRHGRAVGILSPDGAVPADPAPADPAPAARRAPTESPRDDVD